VQALKSLVDSKSEEFRANRAAMRALVDDLRVRSSTVRSGGGAEAQAKHAARGKLLPRERIDHLIDPGAPFLEIGQFAAYGMYGDDAPSAGLIAGVGRVQGMECLIVANDATVKGGTCYPMTVKKHLRAQEIGEARRSVSRSRPFRPHLFQQVASAVAGLVGVDEHDGRSGTSSSIHGFRLNAKIVPTTAVRRQTRRS